MLDKLYRLANMYDPDIEKDYEPWESGNYNDCYDNGMQYGANLIYRKIKDILNEITSFAYLDPKYITPGIVDPITNNNSLYQSSMKCGKCKEGEKYE